MLKNGRGFTDGAVFNIRFCFSVSNHLFDVSTNEDELNRSNVDNRTYSEIMVERVINLRNYMMNKYNLPLIHVYSKDINYNSRKSVTITIKKY